MFNAFFLTIKQWRIQNFPAGGRGAAGRQPIITGRNEVVAKVIFLHLFVILFTGVCLSACWNAPPRTRETPHPRDQGDPQLGRPPGTRETPRPGRPSQDQGDPPRPGRPPGPGRPPEPGRPPGPGRPPRPGRPPEPGGLPPELKEIGPGSANVLYKCNRSTFTSVCAMVHYHLINYVTYMYI